MCFNNIFSSTTQIRQAAPLLLEAINTILSKIPTDIQSYPSFQELLWYVLHQSLSSLAIKIELGVNITKKE